MHNPEQASSRTIEKISQLTNSNNPYQERVNQMIHAILKGDLNDPDNPVRWQTQTGLNIVCCHPYGNPDHDVEVMHELDREWLNSGVLTEDVLLPGEYLSAMREKAPNFIVMAYHETQSTRRTPIGYVIATRLTPPNIQEYITGSWEATWHNLEASALNNHQGNYIEGVGVVTLEQKTPDSPNFRGLGLAQLMFLSSHRAFADLPEEVNVHSWVRTPKYANWLNAETKPNTNETYASYIDEVAKQTEGALRTNLAIGGQIIHTGDCWPDDLESGGKAVRMRRTGIVKAFKYGLN